MVEPSKDNVVKGDFQPRCNLCKLGKQSKELLDIIHQMRWSDDKPFRAIVEEVNTIIERDDLEAQGVKPLALSSLVTHFAEHVSPEKLLAHELQEAASKKRKLMPKDPSPARKAIQIHRESLAKIEENLNVWQEIFDQVHKEFKELPAEAVNPIVRKMAVEAMSKAHGAWAELIKAKEVLLKERTLSLEMIQQAVDLYARSWAGSLAEALTTACDSVKADYPGASEVVVDKVYESFRQAAMSSVEGLYEEAIRATTEQYKL